MLKQRKQPGFTLVELLIVIVVIAILAAISIVAYNGIQSRAKATVAKADLSQAAKWLAQNKVTEGSYPVSDSSNTPPDSLRVSDGNNLEYTSDGDTYCLSATNGNQGFHVSNTNQVQEGVCTGHAGPSAGGSGDSNIPSITIGSQTWMAHNLNVGTMIPGNTNQTDNGTIEKYCYDNDEANCDQYGGLYQWNEAMQYTTEASAQGICPAGWHIPSDSEWKTLEMALGMTQAQADANGWRGTDQGTQLKPGGSSGLNIPLAGYRTNTGSFTNRGSNAIVWSSSESGSHAWRRYLNSGNADVRRTTRSQADGFAVRCLKN